MTDQHLRCANCGHEHAGGMCHHEVGDWPCGCISFSPVAAPKSDPSSDQTAWIVVSGPAGDLRYFCWDDGPPFKRGARFVHSANRAFRFPSKNYADQWLALRRKELSLPEDARVEEHMWTDAGRESDPSEPLPTEVETEGPVCLVFNPTEVVNGVVWGGEEVVRVMPTGDVEVCGASAEQIRWALKSTARALAKKAATCRALEAELAEPLPKIDELLSAFQKAVENCDRLGLDRDSTYSDVAKERAILRNEIRATVERLTAENHALLADRERLDWLDQQTSVVAARDISEAQQIVVMNHHPITHGSLREAIGAAKASLSDPPGK